MSTRLFRLSVIGHTNVGKTSLLRTLTRDRDFGEVSIHPATTRHVEATRLKLGDGLGLEFDDTPGFEDSIGLLDALHRQSPDPRMPGPARIAEFLDSKSAHEEYAHEAKALRQLIETDLAIYVVDACEAVSGRFSDEFVILSWSGKPCLAVLNFVANSANHAAQWRDALNQAGLHNIVEFDTVVFNPDDERRLLRQLAVLLPAAETHFEKLIELRGAERISQLDTATDFIVDALIDCAQLHTVGQDAEAAIRSAARQRERRLNRDLLALFRFDEADYAPADLPIARADWSIDLFDTGVLMDLGISLGSSAAKGAAAGAAIDVLAGFTSLGLATAIGGAVGAGVDGINRLRQFLGTRRSDRQTQQLDRETLRFLARRACRLLADLARRGHAAVQVLTETADLATPLTDEDTIVEQLARCRYQPAWARGQANRSKTQARPALRALIRRNLPE